MKTSIWLLSLVLKALWQKTFHRLSTLVARVFPPAPFQRPIAPLQHLLTWNPLATFGIRPPRANLAAPVYVSLPLDERTLRAAADRTYRSKG